MPRKERLFIESLPQLIKLKGHNKELIFRDEDDYRTFLGCLEQAIKRHVIRLHAYCLLDNELFLLLTPSTKESIGKLVQHIGRRYVFYYNKKYQRTGSLWEGRYNSCLIEPSSYFLICQKYVEKLVQSKLNIPHYQYPWSSYLHHVSKEFQEIISEHHEYTMLGNTLESRLHEYNRFFQSPINSITIEKIEKCLNQNCILGTLAYCNKVEEKINRNVRPRCCGRPRKKYYNVINDWVWLERKARASLSSYGYQEIRFPILESDTPAISDYQCSLTSKNIKCLDKNVSLRNDGTSSCIKTIAKYKELQSYSRLWYQGPIFKISKDNAYAIKQSHQIGVESFGFSNIDILLEQIMLQKDFFSSLGVLPFVELKINNLGSSAEFCLYRRKLQEYFEPFNVILDERSKKWLTKTPERILYSYPPFLEGLVSGAPRLHQYLSEESILRFKNITNLLERFNVPFSIQQGLFPSREYEQTVFEWSSERLNSEQVICRGGCYRFLSQNNSNLIPACGFALMLEPILKLLKTVNVKSWSFESVNILVIPKNKISTYSALSCCRHLRMVFPDFKVIYEGSCFSTARAKKDAIKYGCRFTIIVDTESEEVLTLYDGTQNVQSTLTLSKLVNHLVRYSQSSFEQIMM
ncbi:MULTISPECIES: ATP phosphoribosyltransferase regulatory subunit [unclassified Vibrio]|uniref:ATP phosphoribosyltransferase regulatory subunit n=2 Tax=Vibrio TaxID=662 RepID=UPI001482BFB3|nr:MULTISPECIES: ATP phosphoribosyltransferase regulatory subunit [unclassified Vibrio]NNN45564.1 histidine--tRNA ligase [Vibrio sp. 1-1(7)]NNN73393.1 histidine--tRNA ligase [Vibrio sp. 12-2(3-a)]